MQKFTYEPILDNLPAAVLVINQSTEIVYANSRSEAVLKIPPIKLVGTYLKDLLPTIAQNLHLPNYYTDSEIRQRCQYKIADDKEITIGFQVSILGEPNSNEKLYTILFQDITAYQQLRDERDRLLQLAAVGEVLPAILHELKNPMAAITTAVEVLLEEVPSGHFQTELHAVLTEIRRMKLTFEGIGLLDLNMRTNKNQAIDFAIVEAFRVLEAQIKRSGIISECKVPPLPLLPLSATAIRAIIFNLVTNSIHACKAGDKISVTAKLIEHGAGLELKVTDTGAGMPKHTLQHCRDLFFTSKSNGSGIGLFLCEAVVNQASGKLLIESTEGEGTEVTILIPIAKEKPNVLMPLNYAQHIQQSILENQ